MASVPSEAVVTVSQALPSDFYDNPNKSKPTTVWQQIIRSDRVKHAQFAAFDSNGVTCAHSAPLADAITFSASSVSVGCQQEP